MLVYSLAGQKHRLVVYGLCLWVRGTYVTYMCEAAVVMEGREGGGESGNLLSFHLKHIGRPLNLLVEESDKPPEGTLVSSWVGLHSGGSVMCNIQLVKVMVASGGLGLASKSQIPNG